MTPQDRIDALAARTDAAPVRYGCDISDAHNILGYRVTHYGIDAAGHRHNLRHVRTWTHSGAIARSLALLGYSVEVASPWRLEQLHHRGVEQLGSSPAS